METVQVKKQIGADVMVTVDEHRSYFV